MELTEALLTTIAETLVRTELLTRERLAMALYAEHKSALSLRKRYANLPRGEKDYWRGRASDLAAGGG